MGEGGVLLSAGASSVAAVVSRNVVMVSQQFALAFLVDLQNFKPEIFAARMSAEQGEAIEGIAFRD